MGARAVDEWRGACGVWCGQRETTIDDVSHSSAYKEVTVRSSNSSSRIISSSSEYINESECMNRSLK